MRLPREVDVTKLAVVAIPLAAASKAKKSLTSAMGSGATLSSPAAPAAKTANAIVPKMTAGGMPGSATNPFGDSYGGGKSQGPKNQQTNRSAKDAIRAQNSLNENLSGGPKVAVWNPIRKARDASGNYLEGAGHAALDAIEDAKRPSTDTSHLRNSLTPQRQYV